MFVLGTLLFVGAAAGGVYLVDQMVLAPGRALQRQVAERDAQIRTLTERNQALEAAVRLLRYTERRARLVVLDQGPGPEGQVRTRVRFTELDSQGGAVGGVPGSSCSTARRSTSTRSWSSSRTPS